MNGQGGIKILLDELEQLAGKWKRQAQALDSERDMSAGARRHVDGRVSELRGCAGDLEIFCREMRGRL